MNGAAILAAAFPALLIVGVILAPLLARRDRLKRPSQEPRYRDADAAYSQHNRQTYPGTTESGWLTGSPDDEPAAKRDQYFADWAALQAWFNERLADEAAGNDPITVTSRKGTHAEA